MLLQGEAYGAASREYNLGSASAAPIYGLIEESAVLLGRQGRSDRVA